MKNKVCEAIGELSFVGNITPHTWYQSPLLRTESGRPNDVAITLLSDILYWYRPTQVRDEATGKVVELKEKFSADKLQKDYQVWGDHFGYTKRQVQDAISFLVSRNIITRELRVVELSSGQRISNVVFIEPVLETIKILNRLPPPETVVSSHTCHESPLPLSRSNGIPITAERETYTKNTTKSTTESSLRSDLSAFPADGAVGEGKGLAEQCWDVFIFWKETMKKNSNTIFNQTRQNRVIARLKEGYSVEQLKTAILGCRASPHHQGDNDRNQIYDDLELICRDGVKVETFIQRYEESQNVNTATENRLSPRTANQDSAERRAERYRSLETHFQNLARQIGGMEQGHPAGASPPAAQPAGGGRDGAVHRGLRVAASGGRRTDEPA